MEAEHCAQTNIFHLEKMEEEDNIKISYLLFHSNIDSVGKRAHRVKIYSNLKKNLFFSLLSIYFFLLAVFKVFEKIDGVINVNRIQVFPEFEDLNIDIEILQTLVY